MKNICAYVVNVALIQYYVVLILILNHMYANITVVYDIDLTFFQYSAKAYSPTYQPAAITKRYSSYLPTTNGVATNDDSNTNKRHKSFGSSSGPPVSPRPSSKKMVL